ncbi:MAG: beta-galactosidase, partial [bacterium]|nr:beta-galactosidase [bacterium]
MLIQTKPIVGLLLALFFLTALQAGAAPPVAILLDDFENPEAASAWSFSNGAEFPGAAGAFLPSEAGAKEGHMGGELRFDFRQGGNYVAAIRTIPPSLFPKEDAAFALAGVQFDLLLPEGHNVTFRYTDQSGQTLQKPVDCAAGRWDRVIVPFHSWQGHWGGANDGVVHGLPRQIAILINSGKAQTGSLYFDTLTLLAGSPKDLLYHAQYTAYDFSPDEGWGLAAHGPGGSCQLRHNQAHLDFTQGASAITLRPPDTTLLGAIDTIRLRVQGKADGYPVHLALRTHFMTFYKEIGPLQGEGVQELVTDGPPGEGWIWGGGENDGKIHGPLRLGEIRIESNGKKEALDLTLLDLRVDASCMPQNQCLLTASLDESQETPRFRASLQSLAEKPLQGELRWIVRDWDGATLAKGQKAIETPAPGQSRHDFIPLPSLPQGLRFAEAEFQLHIPGQSVAPAQACWLAPWEAEGTDRIEPQSPFGMGVYLCRYGGHPAGLAEMDEAARMARKAGVKWTREDFSWSRLEPRKGEFDFSYYDALIACAKRHGIQVYAILCYWSSWTKPYTAEGLADYLDYVKAIVTRYKEDIHQWEIWNEPNIFFWQGPKEMYAEMLIQSHSLIKSIDPSAEVLGISTSGIDLKFIQHMMDLGTPFDVLTIHPYRRILNDRDFIADLKEASDLVQNADGTKRPVWLTEMGWATFTPHNALRQDFIPTS